MGLENTIRTGNQFASNSALSGFSSVSSNSTQLRSFPARVVRIVDSTEYTIEFEPIKDNIGISGTSKPNLKNLRIAYPKSNQIISIPEVNSIVTISTNPGFDAYKKLGGSNTYYWEIPINIQNARNQNIAPKEKQKPPTNAKTLDNYKNSTLGIIK
jgi:hypothetical protein